MVDVDAPAGDGLTVPLRLHNLLLALAGRIDDSALAAAHELVARADVDEAAELTAGTLIAGRIPLRAAERRELALVLEMSRSDATLVDEIVVDELIPLNSHRFSGDDAPDYGVSPALERTVRVLPDVRSVHAVWRNTPAGAVTGPLPQRVVLVEVGPDGTPPAVAYRVGVALRRTGINAAVEVLNSWAERSGYHEAAMAAARPVWSADPTAVHDPTVAPNVAAAGTERQPVAETPREQRQPGKHSEQSAQPQVASSAPPAGPMPGRRAQPQPAQPQPAQPLPAEVHPAHPERAEQYPAQQYPAEPEPAVERDQGWRSAPSWQAVRNDWPEPAQTEQPAQQQEAPAAPAPVELPEAVESTWSEAFQEEAVQPEEPVQAQRESRAESTTEMSPAELAQLRQALAEDPDKGREIAASVRPGEVVEIPELDLNDPQLSDRDRELLRELHAELAARERAEAARVNGSQGG